MTNTEITISCFSYEEFSLKSKAKMIDTEITISCFSREEFSLDLFSEKGTLK